MSFSRWMIIAAANLSLLSLCVHAQEPIHLVQAGKSLHHIVLNPEASASEKHAAKEFQEYFKTCTGIELPVVEGIHKGDVPMIVLGCGEIAKKLGANPTPQQLGEQGFLLRTNAPHIIIAGTREAGTLYGVHRFLEDYLGVRWYAPGVTKTPAISDLAIPPLERLVQPAFLYRRTSYNLPGIDADLRARMGQNSGGGGPDNTHGIQYNFLGTAHSYFRFISPNEYFYDHPEYFSEIGGIRRHAETQLCLTNPEVMEIVTEKMLKFMEERPDTRQFNFSQMDYYSYCQCPECSAINEKYGTYGGTQYWFINELAKHTSEVYPDKLVSTLAYMYTEEPPENLKMHPNVAVWLCHMFPSCDSHPIDTCPKNANYKRRAIEWSKICSHVYVWHYIVDFAHYYNPFPNFRSVASDLKFYRDIGVEGLYLQGMGHSGGGGEFSLLRPYYVMKMAWDPDQNREEIIHDFLKGYYGPAAEVIWQYMEMLQDKVDKENIHMHLYTNPAQGYLPDEIIIRANELFDQAEAAVKDDAELLERVKVARMPIIYAQIFPRNGYKIEDGKLIFQRELASPSNAAEFVSRMKKHGFINIQEQGFITQEFLPQLDTLLSSELEVVTISNDHLTVDIVPILAGRALRVIDNSSGHCITAYNINNAQFFPFCGGLEDRIGENSQFYGWLEPSMVAEKSPTSVVVAAQTYGNFKLVRKFGLSPDKPILRVSSTLTNANEEPKEARLRSHMELNLGDLRTTEVEFTNLSDEKISRDMGTIIEGLREGEHYRAQKTPRDSWNFTGSKNLRLTQRFNNDQLDHTWIYAYPEDLGEFEVELWAKRVILQPGQSVSLDQELEINPIK